MNLGLIQIDVETDKALKSASLRFSAIRSSSKQIVPESSASQSLKSTAVRSSIASSLSSDGVSSRQHFSIMRISSKSIEPSPSMSNTFIFIPRIDFSFKSSYENRI